MLEASIRSNARYVLAPKTIRCSLIEPAQHRWHAADPAHLVALVRAGSKFENGVLVERSDEFNKRRHSRRMTR